MLDSTSYPRLSARTQRFTLGEPRLFHLSPDGARLAFVRSASGEDMVNALWLLDLATGIQTCVADPRRLTNTDERDLPDAERARRERAREGAGGVVAFATDAAVRVAAFALGGELYVAGLLSAKARRLDVPGPVFDPRPAPDASRLAYVRGRELVVAELDGSTQILADDDDPLVSWGSADFAAAEEMDRSRGYWWSPDGSAIAATRVDNTPVASWWIGDPANPGTPAREHRYPQAGTANAEVSLHILGLDGSRTEVVWNRERFEYLVDVGWRADGALGLMVQSRDQREVRVLVADRATGETETVRTITDPLWVGLVGGGWGWLADNRLVTCEHDDGVRRLMIDGVPVTDPSLVVRSLLTVAGERIVFGANEIDRPEELHLWSWDGASMERITDDGGVHSGVSNGSVHVVRRSALDLARATFTIRRGTQMPLPLDSNARRTPLELNIRLMRLGPRQLPAAVLLPKDADPARPLPVLLDPYGGPGAQRVVASRSAHQGSQWFAEQGFAVLVVDGRGTPGGDQAWEQSIHHDLAGPVLDDQVDALVAAAEIEPRLDLSRVAIRGWSFGGYLAALAVLRRPDVFHAAVAGAPVTEWRLYDTHYTERYLGHPGVDTDPYDASSLLPDAAKLERPLLLIHGLADDNVVAAHTLQLSSALLAAGRPHEVLPLSGVSHMTPQDVVAENLLLLQLDFLRRSLGLNETG